MSRRKLTSDAKATEGRTRREDACGHGIPIMTISHTKHSTAFGQCRDRQKIPVKILTGIFSSSILFSAWKKTLSHKSGARQLAAAGEMCYNGENEEMEEQRWRTT